MSSPVQLEGPGLEGQDYLALLKGELTEHVRRASAALSPGELRAGATPALAVCIDALLQLHGVLDTLGLEHLTLLAHELARVARHIELLSAERLEEEVATLRNGLDQLRDGIERRSTGRPANVWALVAVLNELRAGWGLPLVSETCLFAPNLEGRVYGVAPFPEQPNPRVKDVARQERTTLHRGMFLWFSQREPERGVRKLRRVAQTLREVAGTERLKALFHAFEAFVVAVAGQSATPGVVVRRLIAAVDDTVKRLGELGEETVASAMPIDLLRNLLFYVATSGSAHHLVQSVRGRQDLRLVAVSGVDGQDRAVPLLLAEVATLRDLLVQVDEGAAAGRLTAGAQRLSDGLALAQLGDQRRRLEPSLAALHRPDKGARASADVLAELGEALSSIEAALRLPEFGGPSATAPRVRAAASDSGVEAARLEEVEEEVAAMDDKLDFATVEPEPVTIAAVTSLPPSPAGESLAESSALLDDEIREVFLDEASEKVETVRHRYVAWSAQRDDSAALDGVLEALDGLKSTGRLVGADTLSEVSWVLEAALRRCRDGALPASDPVLAVLDEGIEMVDALVGAHARGAAVPGDPREIEQRIYALLTPGDGAVAVAATPQHDAGPRLPDAADVSGAAELDVVPLDSESFAGDLGLVELFAEEAGDLADTLEEGLEGLEQDPARSNWLLEMRRALRGLGLAARQAGLDDLKDLAEAFEVFLGAAADVGAGLSPDALSLTREATAVVSAAVNAIRHNRLPQLPAGLAERLRSLSLVASVSPRHVTEAPVGPAGDQPAGGSGAATSGIAPELAQQLFEGAAGAGVSHLQIEEQVAILRAQVGRLEGVLALLRRPVRGQPAQTLPPRVAAALEDLGGCADRLHEASLAISSQLRGQGHQLTELQHGLASVFDRQGAPTFVDLLLVGVGDGVYALPTSQVESVRRIAQDLIPAGDNVLELRGRAYAFHRLGDRLGVQSSTGTAPDRPQSIVLARAGTGTLLPAYGVDRVLGQRTLLVEPAGDVTDAPTWLSGQVWLGGDRSAPVVDLAALAAG